MGGKPSHVARRMAAKHFVYDYLSLAERVGFVPMILAPVNNLGPFSIATSDFPSANRHARLQFLEPALDDDDLRRGGLIDGRLDHEETRAVA
jgi:hypothetical protein